MRFLSVAVLVALYALWRHARVLPPEGPLDLSAADSECSEYGVWVRQENTASGARRLPPRPRVCPDPGWPAHPVLDRAFG